MTTASAPDDKLEPASSDKAAPAAKACKSYAVDLSAYFDGELEGDALERLEAHLAACTGCRETLRRLGTLRHALHALARPPRRRRSILEDLQARLAEEGDADPAAPDEPLMS